MAPGRRSLPPGNGAPPRGRSRTRSPRGLDAAARGRRPARGSLRPRAPARAPNRSLDSARMATAPGATTSRTCARAAGVAGSSGPTGRCRCSRDPRALRARAAARGHARLGLPPRDDRDGQPDADAQGRRRGGRALRLESALHPGRRGRGAGGRVRHPHLRHQGRGQRHVLRAHRGGARPPAPPDDGRRRRRDRRAPRAPAASSSATSSAAPRRPPPASSACARSRPTGSSAFPDHRRQRGEDQAPLRQPLRHRPVHPRRHRPRDQHPARGQALRGGRLRLVRAGGAPAGPRHGRHVIVTEVEPLRRSRRRWTASR